MKTIRFLLVGLTLLCFQTLLMAQSNCYETQRMKGIQLYNQGDYTAAYKNFEAAKYCADLPSNNDLDSWLEKCVIVVKLSARRLVFNATGGEDQCVEVSTNAKSFRVGAAPDWCIISQQGKVLHVSCKDNFDVASRETKISIVSGGKTAFLEIAQKSADLEMDFDPGTVVFSSQEETQKVVVVTNASGWIVETVPSWLISDRREDTLLLVCSRNASAIMREAEVVIQASGEQFELPVRQLPGDTVIDAGKKDVVFASDVCTEKIHVISNMAGWRAETSDYWLGVSQQNDSVMVVAQENPSLFSRHGSIRIISGSRHCDVAVHQAPHVSNFTMPESELKSVEASSKDSIMVRSYPSELVVYIDDSIARTTPFACHVDFEHHSLLVGFERLEYLFNEKQQDIMVEPGLRFAQITFTAPKNIGLRTGFVSANNFGAFFHFQASRPVVKEQLSDTITPNGYHFFAGPVYSPIPYLGLYAGVGCGIYEGTPSGYLGGLPKIGFDFEAGVMGFFKNATVSMGFRTSQWNYNERRTTFVLGVGGYLKRYYDPNLGYCCSDSRRWWSLNYMTRPAQNGKGVMFADLGKAKSRAYIKALYLQPTDSIKSVDANIGVVFTPVNGIIDLCLGVGAAVNVKGLDKKFQGVSVELGTIINLWRFPITVMLHESDLIGDRHLFVDFGFGFHFGEFNRCSYK